MGTRVLFVAVAALCCAQIAPAQPYDWANQHLGNWRPDQPDYGFEFVTVGAVGNRAANADERLNPQWTMNPFPNLGSVNHAYRISTTEVTASQLLPFIQAIRPSWNAAGGHDFTLVPADHFTFDGFLQPAIREHEERSAVRVHWTLAAYYCNWLHNGAPDALSASVSDFTTGAYDISFVQTPLDEFVMPATHNEGAKYWIPTVDEWVKAAHYDPNRHGEGQEGYWKSMGGQDGPLTPGSPFEGGETSATMEGYPEFDEGRDIPVAAYADITSPWGLFDTSGGESEWTETMGGGFYEFDDPTRRYLLGSGVLSDPFGYWSSDAVDGGLFPHAGGDWGEFGFRLASAVPAPSAGVLLLSSMIGLGARRRR